MLEKKEMLFGVVAPPQGIVSGCKHCHKIVARGVATIEVQVVGDSRLYSLGSEKKFFCCGEEKRVPELFDSADAAEHMIQTIEKGLRDDGSVAVILLEWTKTPQKPETKVDASVTTIPIGEKGVAQVGEGKGCEDGGILRI